jgi:ADP-ribose pyrophosphatase YjhB (NUDIX family)
MPIKKFARNHSLLVLYKPNWKILFQDRASMSKWGEKYGFFGWWVDKWETYLEACLRETKEELNLDLKQSDVKNAARFSKTVIGIRWTSKNFVYVSPWKQEYEKDLQILEWDGWVWMALEQAKKEVFFNHDYMVFDLLERYFECHDIFV